MAPPLKDLSSSVKPSGLARFHTLQDSSPYIPPSLSQPYIQQLTLNALSLFTNLIPTTTSLQQRKQFLSKLQHILDSEFPNRNITAHLFGSTVNGLGTTSSDVDVCLVTPWTDSNGVSNVRILAQRLQKYNMLNTFTIAKAKVPICKFYDPEFHLNCDINVNNTIALRNTRLIRTYVDIDSRVRPLLMIIKHWANKRALNDAAKGGTLSSYCWVMMGIQFLQTRNPPILPCLHDMYLQRLVKNPQITKRIFIDGIDCSFFEDLAQVKDFGLNNQESVGSLLFNFFKHFALEFDYENSVISVRHGQYLTKVEKGWHTDTDRMCRYLCVEEPFNPQRNLANSADSVSVQGLKMEFQRALRILAETGDMAKMCESYVFPNTDINNLTNQTNQVSPTSNILSQVFTSPTSEYSTQAIPNSSDHFQTNRNIKYNKNCNKNRPHIRHFGTGMYPKNHKEQQTEQYPFYHERAFSASYNQDDGFSLPETDPLPFDYAGGNKQTQTDDNPILDESENTKLQDPTSSPDPRSTVSNPETFIDQPYNSRQNYHRSLSLNRDAEKLKNANHARQKSEIQITDRNLKVYQTNFRPNYDYSRKGNYDGNTNKNNGKNRGNRGNNPPIDKNNQKKSSDLLKNSTVFNHNLKRQPSINEAALNSLDHFPHLSLETSNIKTKEEKNHVWSNRSHLGSPSKELETPRIITDKEPLTTDGGL